MIVEFYRKKDGSIPVEEFLDSLPKKLSAKTARTIAIFEEQGYKLQMPFVEKIDSNIWELRTIQGNDITRIMYFFFDGDKAILTNGFIKKSNKIPIEEIRKAKDYRKDYYRRYKK